MSEQTLANTTQPTELTSNPESMSEIPETKDTEMQDVSTQLSQAKTLINEDHYEQAVQLLSTLLESLTKEAQVQNPHMAELYHFYGLALFRLSQLQNDVFGAPIREKQAEYAALQAITEEGDENVEEDTEMEEANGTTEQETADDAKEASPKPENDQPAQQQQEETTPAETDGNQEESGDATAALANALAGVLEQAHAMKDQMEAAAANGDVDTSEDRVLAWESLETARSLLSESTDVQQKNLLAETHLLLAELQLEDESFDSAAQDFAAAVRIYQDIKAKPRVISAAYYLWAISSGFNEKHALAKEQFEMAADLMLQQVAEMSEQTVDAGGPKSEASETLLLAQKDQILDRAKQFAKDKGGQVKKGIENIIELFEETAERIEECGRVETEKMEVDRVMNEENAGGTGNGVTTIGFEPAAPTSAPINDLGVVTKKKKRTANDAGLEAPQAKKQRIEA